MHVTSLHEKEGVRALAVVFETGDNVTEGLLEVARNHDLSAARFTAIGAFQEATLAYFDVDTTEYVEIPVNEQVEVLALTGNIARHEGAPTLHAHVVVGKRDGTTRGGHLMHAIARPTLEVMLTEMPADLRREVDETTGLPLLVS